MSKKYSITCPNCASPLTLLGGGRVSITTCSYCKSVIDLEDNYKILSNFKNTPRPDTPFEIGMIGEIKGIEYTIIGIVQYEITTEFDALWTDFLLFSPLYGYAYLTYEKGHLIFSRRTRDFPALEWNEIKQRRSMISNSRSFSYHGAYNATLQYIEGELTWIAKKGDKTSFIDLIAPPYGISVENNRNEIEYYLCEYMSSEEIYSSFGIPKDNRREEDEFNPLKPFHKPILKTLSRVAMVMLLLIASIIIGLSSYQTGKKLLSTQASNRQTINQPFTVTSNRYLLAIEIASSSRGDIDNFNIKIEQNKKNIFTLDKYNGFIFNHEQIVEKKLSSWKNNAKKAIAYIKLKREGEYNIIVTPVDKMKNSSISIVIKEQSARGFYFIYLAIITIILFLIYYLYKLKYRQQLKKDSDQEESSFELDSDYFGYAIFFIVILFIILFGD